jgi:hypothetical protein
MWLTKVGRRKIQLQSYSSVCDHCNQEETLEHLFWICPFSSACWDSYAPKEEETCK